MTRPRFHLAFPVRDLAEARAFYGGLLGCPEGRSSDAWIDFDFYGHQIVAQLAPDEVGHRATSAVDGEQVPVRHFGAILTLDQWGELAAKLKEAGTRFIIEPQIRSRILGKQEPAAEAPADQAPADQAPAEQAPAEDAPAANN